MAGRFETSDGRTKVIFEFEGLTAKVAAIAGDAAEHLWREIIDDDGVVVNPFASASNQEKLDVIDAHVKRVILDLANANKSKKAQRVARETEKANEHSFE